MSRSAFPVALVLLLVLPALAGCPTGGGPDLRVYPSAFSFGPTATTDTFTVSSRGGGSVEWQVEGLPAWLSATPASGTAGSGGQLVTLTVDRTGLAPGDYSCDFQVGTNEGNLTLAATMRVEGTADAPVLHVEPAGLDLGLSEVSGTLTVTNTGNGTLDWSVLENVTWLSVLPVSGSVGTGADSDAVTVTVDRSSLPAGANTANIQFASNGGDLTVPVSVQVASQAPVLGVQPAALSFPASTDSLDLTVSNTGLDPLLWNLNEDISWLSVQPATGQLGPGNTSVTVTVDRTGLEPGTYTGSIAADSNGGTAAIGVSMVVAPAALSVSPASMQFGAYATTKLLSISNAGSGALDWSVDTSAFPAWLTLAPSSGHIAAGTTAAVVGVNRTGVEVGNASHTFTVTSNAGAAEVTVWMTVLPVPVLTVETELPGQALISLGVEGDAGVFAVRNTGSGTLDWSTDSAQFPEWLVVTPLAGALTPGQVSLVQVGVLRDGLATGGYTYSIPITSNGGSASVEVTFLVPLQPAIAVDPIDLDFGLEGDSGSFYVANSGDANTLLQFRVESDKEWLFFSPPGGTSVGTSGPTKDWQRINVSVDRSRLESTGPTGTLTITAVDATGEVVEDIPPQTVTVSVQASPLSFEGAQARLRIPSMVRFGFIMRDFRDRAIPVGPADLTDAFQIFEKGVALERTETNQFVSDKYRVNLVLMLDMSGSMLANAQELGLPGTAPLLEFYRGAAREFIDSLPANWQVCLMEFHERHESASAQVIHDFTTDRQAIYDAFAAFNVEDYGASELLPSVVNATQNLIDEDDPLIAFDDADLRAVVVLSDGRMTTPPGDVDQYVQFIIDNKTRVFPVGWGRGVNSEPLARLAGETGGHFYGTRPDTSGAPQVSELEAALATLSADLRANVVLSYTTLNEEPSTNVRVNAAFNPPADVPDQGLIQGSFSQQMEPVKVIGDIRLGQISMRSSGIADGRARLFIRADYIPRNVTKFAFRFTANHPYDLSVVPASEGGLVEGWTLEQVNGQYLLTAPGAAGPLPYGSFGDLFQLDFTGAASDIEFDLEVDNTIYGTDVEPKYFIYPDFMRVGAESVVAPSFPTMKMDPTELHFLASENVRTVNLSNIGGAYPQGVPNPTVQLEWSVADKPSWITVIPEEGSLASARESTNVAIVVDRVTAKDATVGTVSFEYDAGAGTGAFIVTRTLVVYLDSSLGDLQLSLPNVSFGDAATTASFEVLHDGIGVLNWAIDPASMPAWLSAVPDSGTFVGSAQQVILTADRTGLTPGGYAATVSVISNRGTAYLPVDLVVPLAP